MWRFLHSLVWYLGHGDSKAGLSWDVGQSNSMDVMISLQGLGFYMAWQPWGNQFLI